MQAQVRDADRVIVQTGDGLGARPGHTVVEVDAETRAAIWGALRQPNGGVVLEWDGTITITPPDPVPEPPPRPDYGDDATPAEQVAAGVVQLRAYLPLPSPTGAQTVAAVKLVIRCVLFVLRRQL